MKQQNDVLLKVDHLCQYFRLGRKDLKAVDDVNFEIRKGEAFGLVGESGCGKTTTGRSIIRLYNITSGNVYFKGERIGAGTRSYKDAIKAASEDADIRIDRLIEASYAEPEKAKEYKKRIDEIDRQLAEIIQKNRQLIREAKGNTKAVDRRYSEALLKALEEEYAPKLKAAENDPQKLKALRKELKIRSRVAKKAQLITQIQMIFQDPMASLNERAKVSYIVSEGLLGKHLSEEEIGKRVSDALMDVGLLPEFASRFPHEFSGGQRQRIGIARALVMEPDFIIADEPISALDVSIRAQVLNLLSDLQKKRDLTYLFIAHDLSVVRFICDRIAVIHKGKIVELADSEQLFAHPLHPYTRALLSAIPMPDPKSEKNKKLLVYDPSCHDYSVDKPVWHEIEPGHFILGNQKELSEYAKMI